MSVFDSTSAPPLTSRSRPIIAPSPTSSATLASVVPKPSRSVGTTLPKGIFVARAVRRETRTSATKACIFNFMMRKSSASTAVSAMSSRIGAE